MTTWERYSSSTDLSVEESGLHVRASGAGGLVVDIPVKPGATYRLKPGVTAVGPGHVLTVGQVSDGRIIGSRGMPLTAERWFPSGTIVQPETDTIRLYLYADAGTDFSTRGIDLISLLEDRGALQP
jgi:hypothetical protein